jgi:hypothetical protein
MDFPQLVTEAEASDLLGVPIETIALWAREGRLLAAARTEGGQLLFYRWRVERDGAALAAFAPITAVPQRGKRASGVAAPTLACGCRLVPASGRLCRTGAGFLAAASFAESLAAAAPGDALFARLAGLCRDVLSRHLTGPLDKHPTSPARPPLPLEVVTAIERLEGREPDIQDCASGEGAGSARPTRQISRVAT